MSEVARVSDHSGYRVPWAFFVLNMPGGSLNRRTTQRGATQVPRSPPIARSSFSEFACPSVSPAAAVTLPGTAPLALGRTHVIFSTLNVIRPFTCFLNNNKAACSEAGLGAWRDSSATTAF